MNLTKEQKEEIRKSASYKEYCDKFDHCSDCDLVHTGCITEYNKIKYEPVSKCEECENTVDHLCIDCSNRPSLKDNFVKKKQKVKKEMKVFIFEHLINDKTRQTITAFKINDTTNQIEATLTYEVEE